MGSLCGSSASLLDNILQENESKKIQFDGSRYQDFRPDVDVIVSFPGAHGFAWNLLTQRSLKSGSNLLTSCVFLPDEQADGYGVHSVPFVTADGTHYSCHCQHLYGQEQSFGCMWYVKWMLKTEYAANRKCKLIVVTKIDGSLGRSQEGEVRFLYQSGFAHDTIDILEFAKRHSPVQIAKALQRQELKDMRQKQIKELRMFQEEEKERRQQQKEQLRKHQLEEEALKAKYAWVQRQLRAEQEELHQKHAEERRKQQEVQESEVHQQRSYRPVKMPVGSKIRPSGLPRRWRVRPS
mmetsp:Transcript_80302/g.126739  ORF Transcript_80302/g.126739 Transcript_80302/m.126739 type:complete len:294 (+) Transcript_80302:71-952(+)